MVERGDYLVAFDAARAAVENGASDPLVRYLGVLALARSGATRNAQAFLDDWGLRTETELTPELEADVHAVQARLAKDHAFASAGSDFPARCRDAAQHYETIWDRLGSPFGGVNAATLWLLGGDEPRARALAASVRTVCADEAPAPGESAYWNAATLAECALVLGECDAARVALEAAAAADFAGLGARASTRRQLRVLCAAIGIDSSLLRSLPVPAVVHFTGHVAGPSGRFPPAEQERIAAELRAMLDGVAVGFAYGALAAGADIVVAEVLLRRRAELHVFLPGPPVDFIEASVAPGGSDWVARFGRCIAAATSVTIVTDEPDVTDPALLAFNARVAMGHALLRARDLEADALQLAVWDGAAADPTFGTGAEVSAWHNSGAPTYTVAIEPRSATLPSNSGSRRRICAVLFSDFRGFGRLLDAQIETFLDVILPPIVEVLDEYADVILDRNLWGDGLQVYFDDVAAAARCALEVQECVRAMDLRAIDLPDDFGLRIGLHAGPVVPHDDPVRRTSALFGAQVTRAARVEPVAPEGEVYTTDPFAALLALNGATDLGCQYVGRQQTAKDHGVLPLYLLARTSL